MDTVARVQTSFNSQLSQNISGIVADRSSLSRRTQPSHFQCPELNPSRRQKKRKRKREKMSRILSVLLHCQIPKHVEGIFASIAMSRDTNILTVTIKYD
jgi:hypothetical protein